MSDIAISFQNISKQYRLGLVSTRTLSHDLNRWWQTSVLRREDPYLKIGETNDRSKRGDGEYVWALRDITFDVKKGDVIGIIGKNGAGKSTLLKILSRVTAPTTGIIRAEGKIASLLEVGTGFHPELTGRENIYMNGAIRGMTKAEINRKLDEIVDFAGVERYIDTPVKRYSSGMTVRLGFAIAAHLEPDILVVDEVLAVGDAEFQKKAIGKMQDVSKGEGRTVLFVSHNMGAVKSLCNKGVLLEKGEITQQGVVEDVIRYYLKKAIHSAVASYETPIPKATDIKKIEIVDAQYAGRNIFEFTEKILFRVNIDIEKRYLSNLSLGINMKDQMERIVFSSNIHLNTLVEKEGNYNLLFTIPDSILMPNKYAPVIALHIPNQEIVSVLEYPVQFMVTGGDDEIFRFSDVDLGCVKLNCTWNIM